ncbi:hypothetical protein IL54_2587 [Sphingobium sp. ba1]|nr:hypothetical protein IL54_2587 [Sphingobium sp. ba1]
MGPGRTDFNVNVRPAASKLP